MKTRTEIPQSAKDVRIIIAETIADLRNKDCSSKHARGISALTRSYVICAIKEDEEKETPPPTE